ncbi:UDP-N-acetylmuramate--L-alanine ligase [Acidiluteibacter ferrifornacis]|uniref:Peptidoglycan synthetase n=1 Tax=Acidiluteibacter ferrifornacis TaxID=2692424 RepID=A0A6N9NL46_9FLAO|nr:Mur ligase domain-containing protein [Acidiluteibacter ferrifornacis]NBG65867.1 peptidoglycan synthetase [Acidiluteibacter ferrifornacis]
MKVHFIAIGGSAMHNLALALHSKGYTVSGSDDQIFEPSYSRLDKVGILPTEMGWRPELISSDLDAIILGMHARKDNPELLKAQELGLKIYSYPEYIYEQSKDKQRVVIGGSHGKTSITSMILHVLNHLNMPFDYLVGAQLEGFERMVQLSDAPLIILEGDEYLSSPIDLTPKFLWYKPQVALLSGIAWDHINVFPTFEIYKQQFQLFAETIQSNGSLIYFSGDENLNKIAQSNLAEVNRLPYHTPNHIIENEQTFLTTPGGNIPLAIFGNHNLQNLEGARLVCQEIGISSEQFYEAIQSFKGAAKRLELIGNKSKTTVYKDFAHSPSKLKATVNAVKSQYKKRNVVALMELHTFSSLNSEFLQQYNGSMNEADEAIVYYNPKTIAHKKLDPISIGEVKAAFDRSDLKIYTDSKQLQADLLSMNWDNSVLLLMTSGNFDGVNLNDFGQKIIDTV